MFWAQKGQQMKKFKKGDLIKYIGEPGKHPKNEDYCPTGGLGIVTDTSTYDNGVCVSMQTIKEHQVFLLFSEIVKVNK